MSHPSTDREKSQNPPSSDAPPPRFQENLPQNSLLWQTRAARLFCLLAGAGTAFLLFRYALPCLIPFLIAWPLSFPIRRGATLLQKHWHISRRVGAIVLLIALILPAGVLIVYVGERLIAEIHQLFTMLGSGEEIVHAAEQVIDFFTRITAHIPPLRGFVEDGSMEQFWTRVDAGVAAVVSDTLTRWSSHIPDAITTVLRAFPTLLILLFTVLVTLIYCCVDDGKIAQFLHTLIPPTHRPAWQRTRQTLLLAGANYLRAYFLLFLFTFAQLFLGFSILRLPYCFLPAMLIAAMDILPLLGTGTALIPWSVIAYFRGDTRLALGLLILFGVMLLLRQWLEPHIVGSSLGLHPIVSLLSVSTPVCALEGSGA